MGGPRAPAVALGGVYLVSIAALGPLLGQTADSAATYQDHFANDAALARDVAGGIGLVLAAGLLIWLLVATRAETLEPRQPRLLELCTAFGLVAAAVLMVAAALLLTVPFSLTLGEVTGDSGIATAEVQAGIAQAGSVALFVAALPLAVTVICLGKLGFAAGRSPRWIARTAWATAVLLVLGCSVGGLVPFGAWAIAFGLTWRVPATEDPSGVGKHP